MSTKEEEVRKLREFIDKNGLRDAEDTFDDVVTGHDPALIRPLLLMRPYSEANSAYLHESWAVLHAVEGYPNDIYVRELLATAPELSPDFLQLLTGRIINSETCAPIFIEGVGALPAPAKKTLETIFKGFLDLEGLSDGTRKNCEAVLEKVRLE